MSADLDSTSVCSSSAVPIASVAPPQSFNPTSMGHLEGRPILRRLEQLRLHPSLGKLGWAGGPDAINDASRTTNHSMADPVLITTKGIILAGYARWRLAVLERTHELQCVEYPLDEHTSLLFILAHHQTRCGWNDFVRIRLALTQEPTFQQRALDNMRVGGMHKGLANLPKARRIDVRHEIARAAGVGARNVSHVKTILQVSHQALIEGLTVGRVSINRAVSWCTLPKAEQMEQFTNYLWQRATNKIIRRSVEPPAQDESKLDVVSVLHALLQQEARKPGSVRMRFDRRQHTIILVAQDLLVDPHAQMRLKLA